MTNCKQTGRALAVSALALLLCVAMLIGTTFAWFTDSTSTAVNRIEAGTLKVELWNADGTAKLDGPLTWKKAADGADQAVLWEPGARYELEGFRIKSVGSLALKYKLAVSGLVGDSKLLDAIDFTVTGLAGAASAADLDGFEGVLLPEETGNMTDTITITGTMKPTAGNEYQGLSIDGIAITVYATQYTHEYDSTKNTYDGAATYLNTDEDGNPLIGSAGDLLYLAQSVNTGREMYRGKTVKLIKDIDLSDRNWTPIGTAAHAFVATFDGQGHTISHMTVDAPAAAGLFGYMYGKVLNLNMTDATVTGHHWGGVIAGYSTANNMTIDNCTVENSSVLITPEAVADGYDNGDKAGGIIGYCVYGDTVSRCTVKNTTVQAYRDLGGIVGCALGNSGTKATVTDNTVTDVMLIQDNTNGYETGTVTTCGEIVGRFNDLTDMTGSTATGVTKKVITVKEVADTAALTEALSSTSAAGTAEKTVLALAGNQTYILPKIANKEVVLSGDKTAVLDMTNSPITTDQNSNLDLTVDGLTVKFAYADYKGIKHSKKVTFQNCTLIGRQTLYADEVEFIGCTFESTDDYAVWTYAAKDVTFTDCIFNSMGKQSKAVLCYHEGGLEAGTRTFNRCRFVYTGTAPDKSAIMINPTQNPEDPADTCTYDVTINDCAATGYKENGIAGQTIVGVKPTVKDPITVILDGTTVYQH